LPASAAQIERDRLATVCRSWTIRDADRPFCIGSALGSIMAAFWDFLHRKVW
jgi:hypothetical protein